MIKDEISQFGKKLSPMKRFVFIFGFVSALTPLFWIVMVIYNSVKAEDKFWNQGSLKVVYIFGWISLVIMILSIILTIFRIEI